jgi:E3 ubiquitin-protein ligase DOA10
MINTINLFDLEKSKTNPLYVICELEMKECRICLETSGDLISICGCNGSLKYIHKNCIEQWISHNGNNNICELCNKEYNIELNTVNEETHCNNLPIIILYLLCIIIILILIVLFTTYI